MGWGLAISQVDISVITMNHLVGGGESPVNGFTMTLLGRSQETLRRQMVTWTRCNPIQVVGRVNDHPLSVSELVCVHLCLYQTVCALMRIVLCGIPVYMLSANCTTIAVCALKCIVGLQQLETWLQVVMDAVLGACQAAKGVKPTCLDGVGGGAL